VWLTNLCLQLQKETNSLNLVFGVHQVMAEPVTAEELASMAASYRTQAGHLTRGVQAANLIVAEAVLHDPSSVIMEQLKRGLAKVRDQEEKCAGICEDIRDAQEQTLVNEAHIEGCFTRDAN
jgi:ABC-type Na+ transport system ATPase subunit NatA